MDMVDVRRGFVVCIERTPGGSQDRLPTLQAAGLIVVMSLAVWGVIALGVSLVAG
jgi:hypothetical protein